MILYVVPYSGKFSYSAKFRIKLHDVNYVNFSVRNIEDVKILILAREAQKNSERVGSVAIFTLAWQFLTDNSSPDILVDSHHCETTPLLLQNDVM